MQPTVFLKTGQHPTTQRETSALLDWFRSTFLSIMPSNNKPQAPLPLYGSGPTEPDPPKPEPKPKTKMQTTQNPFQPFGMSAEQGLAIAERAPKGKLLATLTKEYLRQEQGREGKGKASAPVRPASAPAPAAPAAVMPSASAIGGAIARELVAIEDQRKAAAKIKTREQFTAMSPKEQSLFCRNGGKLTD
jgi:hypothetical protein